MKKQPIRADSKVAPEPFAGRGSVIEPVHTPGATGRPMNRREDHDDIDDREAAADSNPGGSSGTSRSVKTTNKRRKDRAA